MHFSARASSIIETMQDGDVIILNDPYEGGTLTQRHPHSPIFNDGGTRIFMRTLDRCRW